MATHSCSYLFSRTNTCASLTRHLFKLTNNPEVNFRQYTIYPYRSSNILTSYPHLILKLQPQNGAHKLNQQFYKTPRRYLSDKTENEDHKSGDKPSKTNETSPVKPHMIYFQNPLIWLLNRWDFLMLKWNWDPGFSLPDFRRGCKQALCTITQCIADENYSDLKGLISAQTLSKLKDEVNSAWNLQRRKDVGLQPEQVHVVLPHKVYLQKVVENKFCDVDMILVAFKPRIPSLTAPHIGLLIEAAIRFHRNYTEGVLPDWTVTRLFLKSRDVHLEKGSTD